MKQNWEEDYEMPAEVDFSKLKRVPNPFSQKFQDLNLVSLDDDTKAAFPDSKAVNEALRELLEMRKSQVSAKELLHSKAA
jgi:hypothetical protein